jgi:hypothetical protein
MTMTNRFRLLSSILSHRSLTGRKLFAVGLVLFCSVPMLAQYRPDQRRERDRNYDPSLNDRTDNGVSAGGKWTSYQVEDRMTAGRRIRFELPADDTRDSDERARVILYCTDGKLNLADFHPNLPLSRPNWPGFWGQPQMRVTVRVDDAHSHHSWNWVHGHFLGMDKGTARELIGAHLFRVEFHTPDGPRIAEFSPSGLDLDQVSRACGLKPKRP